MSFEPDNKEHELTQKELLAMVLGQLNIIRMHNEIITGQIIKVEDINNED